MSAPSTLATLADFLASVEILSPFTRAELERLAQHAESRFYAFGDTVCNAGEPADGLFVIKSGSVRIFTEEHGKEISMGVRRERAVFAEIAMLRECRHESSVRASVKSELVFIPRDVPYEFEGEMRYVVVNGPAYRTASDEVLPNTFPA